METFVRWYRGNVMQKEPEPCEPWALDTREGETMKKTASSGVSVLEQGKTPLADVTAKRSVGQPVDRSGP